MATWVFEPGHTEVGFRARHTMVTPVRGLFKDVHGWPRITFQGRLVEGTGAIEHYRS